MADENGGFEVTRRRALAGLGTLGAASAAAGAGTMAYFSDTESSTGNTVSAGTLDLTATGNGGSVTFNVSNKAPGDSGTETITLSNDGTIDGFLNLDIGSVTSDGNGLEEPEESVDDSDGSGEGELADWLNLQLGFDADGSDDLNGGEAVVDGPASAMDNVEFNPNTALQSGTSVDFLVEWEIPSDAGNEIQGDDASVDFTFELLQTSQGSDVVLTGDTQYGQGAGFAHTWDMTTDVAHTGTGAWGTIDRSGQEISSYKQGFYFGGLYSATDALPEYTVSEIDEISYWLYEPTNLDPSDIYLNIYTQVENDGNDAATWYDSRLQALPSKANNGSPSFTPDEWNKFSTATGATNTLTWSDTGRGGDFNETLPTLDELQNGALDWDNYGADLSTTHDYTEEKVLALSLQVGSTNLDLEAWIDDVTVKLTTGETVNYDLEP